MKKLSLDQMAVVKGGGAWDCVGFALGVIGVAAAVASIPATGPIGVAAAIGLATGSIGTGISGAYCFIV